MANWQVISLDTTTPQLRAPGTGDGYSFNSGSTQLGVWTTTGLGIGTASPTTRLEVNNGINNTDGTVTLRAVCGTAGLDPAGFFGTTGAHPLILRTNATERLRIDSAGNMGLGVTPSAWAGKAFQIGNVTNSGWASIGYDANGKGFFATSAYNNSGSSWTYTATGFAATLYSADSGAHKWYTAPSGTAGNPISFGDAKMTLQTSGNLHLGDTAATNYTATAGSGYWASGSATYAVGWYESSGNMLFRTATTERARIDSSGRLLVGGTSAQGSSTAGSVDIQNTGSNLFAATRFISGSSGPFLALQKSRSDTVGTNTIVADGDTLGTIMFGGANGTGYSDAAFIRGQVDGTPGASADMPGRLVFATSADGSATPTERARITSGGAFCVGSNNYATAVVLAKSTSASTSVYNSWNSATSGTRYHFEFRDDAGATSRGSITTDGANTAYNTSSDRRLKDNILIADDAGSVIDAIQIVKHDWKTGGHVRYGVVAQDLHEVAPEAVSAGDDGEEIEKTWGVDYSKLVPMLVKEIQSLRARVAQLEAQ